MPEILEIEMYRRGADQVLGRKVAAVHAPDDWYLKDTDSTELSAEFTGSVVQDTRRIGKLLILDTNAGPLGLRFGMTGRLVIDGEPIIPVLEYSSARLDPGWERFRLDFGDSGSLSLNDPRRLGGILLSPDSVRLGLDAWSVTPELLQAVIGRRRTACKAMLLDQKRLAGLGNLLVDELCWRTGVHPARPCDELSAHEVYSLANDIPTMLDELYSRGGSHRGDHVEARHPEARCPRDGAPMLHAHIGGRSTWWCATHQS